MTVSLYCNEYVERIEKDRATLLGLLYGADESAEDVSRLNSPLPPRRGAGKVQDKPR